MQISCPCCHARYSLDLAVQDEAARELQVLLAKTEPALAIPLMTYIGLFRSRTRALSWERAHRLAAEVLTLPTEPQALAAALSQAITALRDKQAQPGWKPMSNHNYLKRVLESTQASHLPAVASHDARTSAARVPSTKTGQALTALQGRKRRD